MPTANAARISRTRIPAASAESLGRRRGRWSQLGHLLLLQLLPRWFPLVVRREREGAGFWREFGVASKDILTPTPSLVLGSPVKRRRSRMSKTELLSSTAVFGFLPVAWHSGEQTRLCAVGFGGLMWLLFGHVVEGFPNIFFVCSRLV